MTEKLFKKVFKQTSLSRSLEVSQYQDAILAIHGKNLVPLTPLETGNLDMFHPAGDQFALLKPARLSLRFVFSFLCCLSSHFLGPTM
jgi:hypothetical protein